MLSAGKRSGNEAKKQRKKKKKEPTTERKHQSQPQETRAQSDAWHTVNERSLCDSMLPMWIRLNLIECSYQMCGCGKCSNIQFRWEKKNVRERNE